MVDASDAKVSTFHFDMHDHGKVRKSSHYLQVVGRHNSVPSMSNSAGLNVPSMSHSANEDDMDEAELGKSMKIVVDEESPKSATEHPDPMKVDNVDNKTEDTDLRVDPDDHDQIAPQSPDENDQLQPRAVSEELSLEKLDIQMEIVELGKEDLPELKSEYKLDSNRIDQLCRGCGVNSSKITGDQLALCEEIIGKESEIKKPFVIILVVWFFVSLFSILKKDEVTGTQPHCFFLFSCTIMVTLMAHVLNRRGIRMQCDVLDHYFLSSPHHGWSIVLYDAERVRLLSGQDQQSLLGASCWRH